MENFYLKFLNLFCLILRFVSVLLNSLMKTSLIQIYLMFTMWITLR
jgi:hypothetical protein